MKKILLPLLCGVVLWSGAHRHRCGDGYRCPRARLCTRSRHRRSSLAQADRDL